MTWVPAGDGESGQMGCEEGIGWPCPWTEYCTKGMGKMRASGAGCQPLDVQGTCALRSDVGLSLPPFPVVLFLSYIHFLAEFSLRR